MSFHVDRIWKHQWEQSSVKTEEPVARIKYYSALSEAYS